MDLNCPTPDTTVPHVPSQASRQQRDEQTDRQPASGYNVATRVGSKTVDLKGQAPCISPSSFTTDHRSMRGGQKRNRLTGRGVVVTACVIRLAFIPPQISTKNTSQKESLRCVNSASLPLKDIV